ncbi:MAG TPA: hypothetical protein ENI94_08290 [Gammaproteobacteria bacterium]|nr:hypothetical protein [Gammaproteobacteria bacterium]
MIDVELIFCQLEDALKGVDETTVDRFDEGDRIRIAEMIINLQMQLDMVGAEAHERFGARLNALQATAASAGLEWRLK